MVPHAPLAAVASALPTPEEFDVDDMEVEVDGVVVDAGVGVGTEVDWGTGVFRPNKVMAFPIYV